MCAFRFWLIWSRYRLTGDTKNISEKEKDTQKVIIFIFVNVAQVRLIVGVLKAVGTGELTVSDGEAASLFILHFYVRRFIAS